MGAVATIGDLAKNVLGIGVLTVAVMAAMILIYKIFPSCMRRMRTRGVQQQPITLGSRLAAGAAANSIPLPSPIVQHQGEASSGGLDPADIQALPLLRCSKMSYMDADQCSVCLSSYREGGALRLLPPCRHIFHRSCIDSWLKAHSSCPLCRTPVRSIPDLAPLPVP